MESNKEKNKDLWYPYLNQFHKESTEKAMLSIQEMKKTPFNYEKELKRQAEMLQRAEQLDKEAEQNWENQKKKQNK